MYNTYMYCTLIYETLCTKKRKKPKKKKMDITKNPYPLAQNFDLVSFESDITPPFLIHPQISYRIFVDRGPRE